MTGSFTARAKTAATVTASGERRRTRYLRTVPHVADVGTSPLVDTAQRRCVANRTALAACLDG